MSTLQQSYPIKSHIGYQKSIIYRGKNKVLAETNRNRNTRFRTGSCTTAREKEKAWH